MRQKSHFSREIIRDIFPEKMRPALTHNQRDSAPINGIVKITMAYVLSSRGAVTSQSGEFLI